jgi:hypothetical protein
MLANCEVSVMVIDRISSLVKNGGKDIWPKEFGHFEALDREIANFRHSKTARNV